MGKLLNISQASEYLNVSEDCLRKWEKQNKLIPYRTVGWHRRYDEDKLKELIGIETVPNNDFKEPICATYARVSSNEQKQKGDLDRQSLRLSEYCAKHNLKVSHIFKEVGSGMNDKRPNFNRLTDMIINKDIDILVIEHKDRLTRFQFNFIRKMFESYGCQVIIVENVDVASENELCQDIMSLLASFSGKLYGQRSAVQNVERKTNKLK